MAGAQDDRRCAAISPTACSWGWWATLAAIWLSIRTRPAASLIARRSLSRRSRLHSLSRRSSLHETQLHRRRLLERLVARWRLRGGHHLDRRDLVLGAVRCPVRVVRGHDVRPA